MTTDQSAAKPHALIQIRIKYRHQFDAFALLMYMLFVYAFGLWALPLGRDYFHMATQGGHLPAGAAQLFAWELGAFGDKAYLYRLVNLALLYLCMLGIYHFINLSVRGFWWFGTFGACLFMANPSHTEAVLNLAGVGDLLPCLAGIAALVTYAVQAHYRQWWFYPVPVVLAAVAMALYPSNAYLFLVVLLYEPLAAMPEKRNWYRPLPIVAVGLAALYLNRAEVFAGPFIPGQMFGSLYFLFYPLGFLPETAHRFEQYPLLAWFTGAIVIVLIALILRKARRPVILYGVLGMAILRLYPGDRAIDPIHMIGGGQLLLPHVLFLVSVLGIIFRAMDHPRWRLPLVGLTSSVAAIFFAMQIISARTWHKAGNEVIAFQQAAEAHATATDNAPLGVLPDYRALRGAPVAFSDAIAYDTPFSKKINAVSLLPMNADMPRYLSVAVEAWGPAEGRVRVNGKAPQDVAPWPAHWPAGPGVLPIDSADIQVEDVTADGFTLVFTPKPGEALPAVIIPGAERWYPDRGKLLAR